MRSKRIGLKFYIGLLLAASLLVVSSCKKEEASQPTQPTEKEVSKPAEAAPSETGKPETEKEDTNKVDAGKSDTKGPETAPLPIKLPKPMFVGTPQNIKVPNLKKPAPGPRPPFLAPKGAVNVAAGKNVTSTDDEPIIGEIDMITDGDKEASDGSYVELGPGKQSVTIDLGAVHEIYAILFWHYHLQARVYFDVVVQLADDPDFITNVRTIFNNDLDNSSGLGIGKNMHYVETSEGKLVDAKGNRGRYVRLYSSGSHANDLNHYIEVEVFGKPVK